MNKNIRNLLTVTLSVFLSFGLFSSNGLSVKADTIDNAKSTLNHYLQSVVNLDVKGIEKVSSDDRFPKADYEKELSAILQNPNERFASYSIVNEDVISNSSEIIIAKVNYLNGNVSEIPFKLENSNGKWTVLISANLPVKNKFKQLTKGTQIPFKRNQGIQPNTEVCSWYLDAYGTRATVYATPGFNMTSNYVTLNLRQWDSSSTPDFEYDLVHVGLVYNTVYGSIEFDGNWKNTGVQTEIYSDTGSRENDVTIEAIRQGNPNTEAISYGEVYQ